jgi:hypothetical protein
MMLAIAGYFPHLPPTPKPVGGRVPDRRIGIDNPTRHLGGREKASLRERYSVWDATLERAGER